MRLKFLLMNVLPLVCGALFLASCAYASPRIIRVERADKLLTICESRCGTKEQTEIYINPDDLAALKNCGLIADGPLRIKCVRSFRAWSGVVNQDFGRRIF